MSGRAGTPRWAGPILATLNYHWLFWIPLVVTAVATIATVLLIPESPIRAPGNIHWLGALLLSAGSDFLSPTVRST